MSCPPSHYEDSRVIALLNSIPWWAASLIANAAIIGIEYLNHAGGYGSWHLTLIRTGGLIVIAQWALYRSFSGAEHWLTAWAVFAIGNAIMRMLGVGLLAGNQIGSWNHVMLGTAVMIGGSWILKEGLR